MEPSTGERRVYGADRRRTDRRHGTDRRHTSEPKRSAQLFELQHWPTPDEEQVRRHRVASWGLIAKYQDAEDSIPVEGECAICYQEIRRLWIVQQGNLLISPWKHDYGAPHPAVPREDREDSA